MLVDLIKLIIFLCKTLYKFIRKKMGSEVAQQTAPGEKPRDVPSTIDVIFKKKSAGPGGAEIQTHVLIEAKAVNAKNEAPDNTVERLAHTRLAGCQMSAGWLENRLQAKVDRGELEPQAKDAIMAGLDDGSSTLVYAQTDEKGVVHHRIRGAAKDGKPAYRQARVSNTAWEMSI